MREVIQEILESEKNAAVVVEAAKAEASRLRSQAEVDASAALTEAREKVQRLIREETARAREESRAAHQAALQKAEEENQRFLATHEKLVQGLVDRVVAFLVTPEYGKEA